MQIVFGYYLDSFAHPRTIERKPASYNALVCGPSGFLNLLETHLGLGCPLVPDAVRIAQYLSALQSINTKERFFSRSFEVDPWSTAAFLLSLRDQLISSGWQGQHVEISEKAETFAQIEELQALAAGMADRHWRVNSALATIKTTPIATIRLVESRGALPFVWMETLTLLEKLGTKIQEHRSNTAAPAETDLGALQRRFLNGNNRIDLRGDGSVVAIDTDDEMQAAEFSAAFLSAASDAEDLVIIRGNDSTALSYACSRYGLPECGTSASSSHRELLQILPLAFEIAWRPLNPTRVLEFLSVRGGPVSSYDASPLVEAIKQQPGIGGTLWHEAWEKTLSRRSESLLKRNPALAQVEADAKAAKDIEEWRLWFSPEPTAEQNCISAKFADQICGRVKAWAIKRASMEPQHSLFSVANAQASTLSEIIAHSALTVITLNQLRNMLDAAMKDGTSNDVAQSSKWSVVDHPGQIWDTTGEILWWGFAGAQNLSVKTQSWSKEEVVAFEKEGIHLESPVDVMQRESTAWRSPVLKAVNSLILVRPRVVAGELAVNHCLWDEIKGVVSRDGIKSMEIAGHSIGLSADVRIKDRVISCGRVEAKPLPTPQREWLLPKNLVQPRTTESFTSFEKLLGCPFAWTLEYKARLRPSATQDLPENERLIGDLAHAVMRRLWDESKNWSPTEGKARASAILDEMIPQVAASLLLPGSGPQLRRCKEAIPTAVKRLIELLQQTQMSVVGCELPYEAALLDTKFGGTVDMVLQNTKGEHLILDLKWTRSPSYLRTKLASGKALQLAAYSWLLSQEFKSAHPPAGFFLLRQSKLHFSEPQPFADAHVASERNLTKTWALAVDQFQESMLELQDGKLIATGVHADEIVDSDALAEPPCNFCRLGHICGFKELK